MTRTLLLLAAAAGLCSWIVVRRPLRRVFAGSTTTAVVERLGPRLEPLWFERCGGRLPDALTLVALKEERVLELWTSSGMVHTYPILAASGGPGPKLREGDRQVPEGHYRVESLNPNSRFHLSMKIDFPNAFDREHAALEGRTKPGTNIFVHGGARSVGCIAIGDTAIEELFWLVATVGLERVDVWIAPRDPRGVGSLVPGPDAPEWTEVLYGEIERGVPR